MNESSPKLSRDKRTLAVPDDIVARLGARRYRLLMQWIRDVNGAFDAALSAVITDKAILLDAGCSRGDPDLPAIAKAKCAVGCDTDLPGLRANTIATSCVASPLETLPFRSESFDVIVCKFVIEHVPAPLTVFKEFWRVLRPGGVLAVLTPNRLSFFAFISTAIPHSVKQTTKSWLFKSHEEDTFRTYYRANTPWTLNRLMQQAGFTRERVEMLAGMWAFFIFNTPLAMFVRAIERAQTHVPLLRDCSTHIMGFWRKPLAAGAA